MLPIRTVEESSMALVGVTLLSTTLVVLFHLARKEECKLEELYGHIAFALIGSSLGIMASVMLLDAAEMQGAKRYLTMLAIALFLGFVMQESPSDSQDGSNPSL